MSVGQQTMPEIVLTTLREYTQAYDPTKDINSCLVSAKASLALQGDPKALLDFSLGILESGDIPLARAFLIYVSETQPERYGLAHLELARLYRSDKNFSAATKQYLIADYRGLAYALPELQEMRTQPDYSLPVLLEPSFEQVCIQNAYENIRLERFLDADRSLYEAILGGSTEALDLLNKIRVMMFEQNFNY